MLFAKIAIFGYICIIMAKNITIKDIAREAGVSIALVSFVMNNRIGADGKQKYRVSETTKERILEVATRLNYRPSSAARMLRQGRTHVIGVILPDSANLFFGVIARELEKITYLHGYTIVFGFTEQDPERFARLVQSYLEKDVEGFILVPAQGSAKCVEQLMDAGKPFVIIDRYYPPLNVPLVLTDNADAMQMAIQELQRQGAQKIELVSYAMRISSMIDREKSFQEILGPDATIYHLPFNEVEARAEQVAEEILRKGTDGIITNSTVPGVAIIRALFRRGVRIQRDIKFVGFDFSNVYSLFDPPIPYIQQPITQIASRAADYLFHQIEMHQKGEDFLQNPERIVLKATLEH